MECDPLLPINLNMPHIKLKLFLTRSSILMLFCSALKLRETSTSFLFSSCRRYNVFKTHKNFFCLHLTASTLHTRYNSHTSTENREVFKVSASLNVVTQLHFYKRCIKLKYDTPNIGFYFSQT